MNLPRVRVVILAAGFSSRLGQAKALVRVHGTSLLRRTLRVVAQLACGNIIVVVPRNAARYRIEALGFDVTFVPNVHRAAGLSSSVRLSIARARYSPACLLLPVDLAVLQRREMSKLLSRWRARPRRPAARRLERRGGIPLILPRWLYQQARAMSGDIGLRQVVGSLTSQQCVLLGMPSAAMDVDTPQDLQIARARLRHSSFNP